MTLRTVLTIWLAFMFFGGGLVVGQSLPPETFFLGFWTNLVLLGIAGLAVLCGLLVAANTDWQEGPTNG